MPSPEPVWRRILGGLVGVAILALIIVFARSEGISSARGEQLQQAILLAAAAAGVVVLAIVKRKR